MYRRIFKRLLDLVLSALGLLLLSPLLLLLSLSGALAMKGSPFFLQQRPGRIDRKTGRETVFRMVKLRTMSMEKDAQGRLLPDGQRLNRYGRLLRRTSLDELPELWNVLKGDMSLIGPRPLLVDYLPLYTPEQHRRHLVRPGITGWAQVNGRNAISWEKKFELDTWYVDHLSLGLDIKILFMTVGGVLGQKGISSETCETMEKFTGTKEPEHT